MRDAGRRETAEASTRQLQRSLASGCRNSNEMTGLDRRKHCEHLSDQRFQVHDVVAASSQGYDRDAKVADRLLEFDALIDRQEHVEAMCHCASQQGTVLNAGPAEFLNRRCLVPDQTTSERARQALIEKNSHTPRI